MLLALRAKDFSSLFSNTPNLYSSLNTTDQFSDPYQTSKIIIQQILITANGNRKFQGRTVAGIF